MFANPPKGAPEHDDEKDFWESGDPDGMFRGKPTILHKVWSAKVVKWLQRYQRDYDHLLSL